MPSRKYWTNFRVIGWFSSSAYKRKISYGWLTGTNIIELLPYNLLYLLYHPKSFKLPTRFWKKSRPLNNN